MKAIEYPAGDNHSHLIERDFYFPELFKQLTHKKFKFFCWGVETFLVGLDNKERAGIVRFRVSGLKFKGEVIITLAWNDTWTIRLVDETGEIVHTQTDVFADMLCDMVDDLIETEGF